MYMTETVAPEVDSILAAAERRDGGEYTTVEARSFEAAFERAETEGRVPVIAEIKPTSPTTEAQNETDPVALAEQMVAGGAAALSVLTEPEHFGGDPATLERVRSAVDVPVLRKDFLLCEEHLDVVAADAALMIARFIDDLPGLVAAANERGFQTLVETHTRTEVEQAVAAGADLVGVNNRDLARLEVDLSTFETVAPAAPSETTLIAESGLERPADVDRMRAAGADAVLIGSAIMDGPVEATTAQLAEARV
jgi:Indole-3-glycerol phosphate synthase